MLFINYHLDISHHKYDYFESYMFELFNKLYLPTKSRNSEDFDLNTVYTEKVKKYPKFLIGRKIPKNAVKYTKGEIESGVFFLKEQKTLRVFVKWVEDLINIIKNRMS